MSVSQILLGSPAGLAPEGGLNVPASQASVMGPTSFQNQAVSGVQSLTGGNAGGLAVVSTVGQLSLQATNAAAGYVSLDPEVNVSFSGGPLTAAAAGYINMTADASARQTAGAAAGTFVLQKSVAGAANVTNYLQINVAGVAYWIPLLAQNPQIT